MTSTLAREHRDILREKLRRDLVRALRSAGDAATALREPKLLLVLRALEQAAAAGRVDLFEGKGEEARVVTWATKTLARMGKDEGEPRRALYLFARLGAKNRAWLTIPEAGAEKTLPGAIDLMLQLPWSTGLDVECARAAFGFLSRAGALPRRDVSSWEVETGVVSEVTNGRWRRNGKEKSPSAFASAVLRGAGFSTRQADDLVRSRIRQRVQTAGMLGRESHGTNSPCSRPAQKNPSRRRPSRRL